MKSATRILGWKVRDWSRQFGGGWKLHVDDPELPFRITFYADTKMNCLRVAVHRAREVLEVEVRRIVRALS